MSAEKNVKIIVCMGSSCFARGNNENLEYIEKLIKENKLHAEIELSGTRCENNCSIGPNIVINGESHHNVNHKDLQKILEKFI